MRGATSPWLAKRPLIRLLERTPDGSLDALHPIALLSGGTDGEDGPTDAAGALVDSVILSAMKERQLDAGAFLRRNDAYHFFEQVDGLIKTGPTHTNVCDLRVVTVSRGE